MVDDEETHFNCLIIGAGISGIDAAYHLKTYCPWVKYAILERRGNLGGTWISSNIQVYILLSINKINHYMWHNY